MTDGWNFYEKIRKIAKVKEPTTNWFFLYYTYFKENYRLIATSISK